MKGRKVVSSEKIDGAIAVKELDWMYTSSTSAIFASYLQDIWLRRLLEWYFASFHRRSGSLLVMQRHFSPNGSPIADLPDPYSLLIRNYASSSNFSVLPRARCSCNDFVAKGCWVAFNLALKELLVRVMHSSRSLKFFSHRVIFVAGWMNRFNGIIRSSVLTEGTYAVKSSRSLWVEESPSYSSLLIIAHTVWYCSSVDDEPLFKL